MPVLATPNFFETKAATGFGFRDKLDFSQGANLRINVSLRDLRMDALKTIFLDNSLGSTRVTLTNDTTQQKIVLPPYSQGFFPFLQNGDVVNVSVNSSGGQIVNYTLLNTLLELAVWNVNNAADPAGVVTVSGNVVNTPSPVGCIDRSASIPSANTSFTIVPANAARKRLLIVNPASAVGQGIPANESVYIDFGVNAGVDNGVSIELQPGGSYDTGGGCVYIGDIRAACATANHRLTVKEFV